MASWQALLLNTALRLAIKPMMRAAGSAESMRGMGSSMVNLWRNAIPKDVEESPVEGEDFDGVWVDVPEAKQHRVLLYLPGGGFVMPSVPGHTLLLSRICREIGARGLLVNYRLAPEHPFPAGLDDCLEAYEHLRKLGIDPGEIAVAGDSAGGGLTLATLVALRDEGRELPAAAVLMSAFTDLTFEGPSRERNRMADPMLPTGRRLNRIEIYAGRTPPDHPLVSPCYADFHGLPPILGQVGSTEILLDDTRRVAVKARAQGVDFEVEVWDNVPHAWQAFHFLPESGRAVSHIGRFLRAHMPPR